MGNYIEENLARDEKIIIKAQVTWLSQFWYLLFGGLLFLSAYWLVLFPLACFSSNFHSLKL
jgi:hypothetical protein